MSSSLQNLGPVRPRPAPLELLEGDGEQDVLGRVYPHCLCLGENVVAGAHLATHFGVPVGHIPFEAVGGDPARLFDREDPDILVKNLFGPVANVDLVGPFLEKKGQTLAREQAEATLAVVWVGLVRVKVM